MVALISVVLSGLLSGVIALAVAYVTLRGSIKRDHEADWRKVKLDHYQDFFRALSGTVGNITFERQEKYADAINRLSLVAPAEIMSKIYDFYDYTSVKNKKLTLDEHDKKLATPISEIRRDVKPAERNNSVAPQYRLIAARQDSQKNT